MHPRLGHDPTWHCEERRRRVAAIPDQVDEERVGKEPLEQPEVLHVHRRLVAPARLPTVLGVDGIDRCDCLADRHPVAQTCANLVERYFPLGEVVQPPEVIDELLRVDVPQMAVGELRHEVRLVGDGELRVAVEHDAQQRRAGTPHAEDDEWGTARCQCEMRTGAERLPAMS